MMPLQPCSDCNRLAFVIFESGADSEVMAALEELELEHYTLFEQTKGAGETGRKEGSAIFPGINTMLLIAMPEDRVEPLVRRLHEIRDSFMVTPGMKVIVTDCVMY